MRQRLQAVWHYVFSREMQLYILFGVLTTVLNLAVYFFLTGVVHMNQSLAYFFAWIAGVAAAFFTNKKFVFASRTYTGKRILFELGTFVAGRLLTLGIGEALITVFVVHLHQSNLWWKLFTNVIEVVGNWMVSKFITFKNKAEAQPAGEEGQNGRI